MVTFAFAELFLFSVSTPVAGNMCHIAKSEYLYNINLLFALCKVCTIHI